MHQGNIQQIILESNRLDLKATFYQIGCQNNHSFTRFEIVNRCTNCGSNDHKSWLCPDKPNVTNNIVCTSCGGAGHIAKDCKAKRPGHGGAPTEDGDPGASASNIDEEYLSLMAELGEGPPPTSEKPRNERHHERRNPFSMFDRNAAPKAIAAAPPPPPMNAVPPPPSHQMSVPPVPPPNYAQPIPPPPQFVSIFFS